MRTIISTGQGRLHLFESAAAIKKAGVEVNVITGWVPSKNIPDKFINFLGKLTGRKNISYGLRKRRPDELNANEIKACSFSEFFIQFLFFISKFKIIKRDNAAVIGWKLFGWQSKKYIKNADIFHVRSGAGQGGAIKQAKKNGLKILVDHSIAHPTEVYNQLVKANKGSKSETFINPNSKFWQIVLRDCKEADHIIVNSDYVKQSFIQNGYDESKISVIHLGIRPDFINIKTDFIIDKKIRLLFTGGFGLRKGAYLIIAAIKELITKNVSFQLDIIGSIVNDIEIPSWFTDNPGIKLHGYMPQDDLKNYLRNSDIYIFPSYSEGSAQSLNEAMAAGLPVIATGQSGASIVHGENGWIIPDDSAEALTEAILILSKDQALREKLGRNATKTIQKDHTWEKYGEQVIELYTKLLNEKSK